MARLERELVELAPSWRLYPVVEAVQALRGVQFLVAITVVAELGDLTRFDNPRQLAAFVGLIPSEHSSGSSRRQGGITKTGNGRARRALVEAAWAYRFNAKVSEHIQQRVWIAPQADPGDRRGRPRSGCARVSAAWSRTERTPNVAVTAIARELLAFMWAIAKEVPLQA